MGSLPDSKYIIKTDGYWFVEAHDVDSSKGYITVSAKGIANGLSSIPNDGADFGPDSYDPNHTGSGIPYTQTSGIQEAFNYAYNNSVSLVDMSTGVFKISANITLPKGIAVVGKGYGNGDNDFYLEPSPPTNTDTITAGTWIIPTSSSVTAIITTNGKLPAQNRIENIRIEGMYLSDAGLDLNAGTEFPNDAISGLIVQNVAVTNCVSKNIDVSHSADVSLFNIHAWTKNTSGDFVLGVYDIVCNSPQSEVDMDNIFSYSPSGLSLSVNQWHCNNSIINAININGNYGNYYLESSYLANGYQNVLENGRINFSGNYTIGNLQITNCFTSIVGGTGQSTTLIDFANNSSASITQLVLSGSVLQLYGGTGYFYNNGSQSQLGYVYDHDFRYYIQTTGTLTNYPLTITTPSVPASGTAQSNNTQHDVLVYLYGGTVTEIQYTPNGGSATQVGTSGPATVRLNRGDSITLTYSAAPTWKWVAV